MREREWKREGVKGRGIEGESVEGNTKWWHKLLHENITEKMYTKRLPSIFWEYTMWMYYRDTAYLKETILWRLNVSMFITNKNNSLVNILNHFNIYVDLISIIILGFILILYIIYF